MKIGLGICARNEEAGIIAALSSVVDSACSLKPSQAWELMICANGCTDGTVALVEQWIMNHSHLPVSVVSVAVANLVEAQRLIATCLKNQGADMFAFFDADVAVDPACIPELIKASADPSVRAAYAVSVPIESDCDTTIKKALNQYDSDNAIFSERKHLHGRAFLIKEWSIPSVHPPLHADDIYLSCNLLYTHGAHAIVRAPKAKVYFHQIETAADFYSAYKRRSLELSKCLQAFPHFRTLPPDQLNRRLLWRKLLEEPLPRSFYWLILLALRKYFQVRFFIEASFGPRQTVEWEPTKTSKKPIHADSVMSILQPGHSSPSNFLED